jgi:hypothetical protein
MRTLRVGLLLAVCAMTGCVWSENYNGLPWEFLAKKSDDQLRTDTLIQSPRYGQAQRFSKAPPATDTTNTDVGTTEPVVKSPAE